MSTLHLQHLHPKLDAGSFERFGVVAAAGFRAMDNDLLRESYVDIRTILAAGFRHWRRKPRGLRKHIRRAKAER